MQGYVLNSSAGVVIEAEGDRPSLERFLYLLQNELPPLARIDEIKIAEVETSPPVSNGEHGFAIRESLAAEGRFAFVPPDAATCADCLRELTTPGDRRYQYPFINCTNCGPRYTIVRDIPYDRARTTMAPFRMCAACQAEYEDPADRRFHAEPNACPGCGPGLALLSGDELAAGAVPIFESRAGTLEQRARRPLEQGTQSSSSRSRRSFDQRLRRGKPDKSRRKPAPRAQAPQRESFRGHGEGPGGSTAWLSCEVRTEADRALLESRRNPLNVLMRQPRRGAALSPSRGLRATTSLRASAAAVHSAPSLSCLRGSPGPQGSLVHDALVMTSANLSEEPIVSRNEDAWPRLKGLADYFLLHNREIQTRVDDSVVRTFEDREYPVRRSRGFAPDPIDLGMPVREILACGGEVKNTLCLTKDRYAILSPHIGDLENLETMEFFREALGHLKRFFRITPEVAAHDLHPNYLSTRFALEECGLPTIGVQHHHAHIASCMADNGLGLSARAGRVIGVALDGTGYGTDGRIWGGEFLTCDFAGFERRGHLRYIPLAGGDAAIRQPWRSALAYLLDAFGPQHPPLPIFRDIESRQLRFVERMIERQIQTVETSSCGRLFDAVASIVGLRHQTTYEGQAAIELEAAASSASEAYPFRLTGDVPLRLICARRLRRS